MMRHAWCCGAALIALVCSFGIAKADLKADLMFAADDASENAMTYPDDETTGSIDRSAETQALPLTDEQRGWVFLSVINLPDSPDADVAVPKVTEKVPDTVELQDLPAMVIRKIPLLLDYKFVKLDDWILVVRPGDRMVVSQIPRYRLVQ